MRAPLLARSARTRQEGEVQAAAAAAPLVHQTEQRDAVEHAPSGSSINGMSQTSMGRRTPTSMMEFPADHFSFGDIAGMGRPASVGGLLQHEFFNRGKGLNEEVRERLKLPAIVESGRHAGRSRVVYEGAGIGLHLLTRDFFISMLQIPFPSLLALFAFIYLAVFFFWGLVWYLVVRYYPGCLYGAQTFVESWTFSIITQMTIGYGNTGPRNCATAAVIIVAQSITDLLLNAVVLGLIFAKVASPKHRAFSIYISDSAVITRRDGILKFMFRVADVRRTQVIEPRVKAWLYTWGEGRVTAEGEHIQVRCEQLDIDYIDGMLLLPLIVEHTIDERSPLCGHTYESLAAMSAEVVVTFEATTEMGNPFFARQSYLAQEIHWGCQFAEVIGQPAAERDGPRYSVDLDHFHDVLCPDADSPTAASQLVVNRAKRAVPYPLLGENTLVLSDVLCVRPVEGQPHRLELACRVADTYPTNMVDVTARVYLYRWRPADWCAANPNLPSFTLYTLQCGYKSGTDRLYLRLPQEVVHPIDDASPLASWLQPGGLSGDADSEIVVLLQAYLHSKSHNRMRQRTYRVGAHVRYGFTFAAAVRPPAECRDGKPRVRWAHFFDIEPVAWAGTSGGGGGGRAGPPTLHLHPSALRHPGLRAYLQRGATATAPESHAPARAQQERNQLLADALDRPAAESPRAQWVAAARAAQRASAEAAAAARRRAAARAGQHADWEEEEEQEAGSLQQAAPEVVRRGSTIEADIGAPADRYAAFLARPSATPGGAEAAAGPQTAADGRGAHGAPWTAAAQPAAAGADPWARHERRRHPQPRVSGPPDLATLSAQASVPLDRYATEFSRPSLDEEAPGLPAGAGAAEAQPAAGAGAEQQYGHQQQRRYLPDVLPSDLTATPGVPLERYAAMVASQEEPGELSGLSVPPSRTGSSGDDGGVSAARLPPRAPISAARVVGPPPGRRRSGGRGGGQTGGAGEEGEDPLLPTRRPGSWQRRRSLASLQAIFEQAESQPPSDSE